MKELFKSVVEKSAVGIVVGLVLAVPFAAVFSKVVIALSTPPAIQEVILTPKLIAGATGSDGYAITADAGGSSYPIDVQLPPKTKIAAVTWEPFGEIQNIAYFSNISVVVSAEKQITLSGRASDASGKGMRIALHVFCIEK